MTRDFKKAFPNSQNDTNSTRYWRSWEDAERKPQNVRDPHTHQRDTPQGYQGYNVPVDADDIPLGDKKLPLANIDYPSGEGVFGASRGKAKIILNDMRSYRSRGHKEIEVPDEWNGAHFMFRTVSAYVTLARTPGGRHFKPQEYSTAWPQHSYDFSDLVAQADKPPEDLKADANKKNWVRKIPTREDLTHMDLIFKTVYDVRPRYPDECAMLLSWAYARYRNISTNLIAARFNISKITLLRKTNAVASVCSLRLNSSTIRPW